MNVCSAVFSRLLSQRQCKDIRIFCETKEKVVYYARQSTSISSFSLDYVFRLMQRDFPESGRTTSFEQKTKRIPLIRPIELKIVN